MFLNVDDTIGEHKNKILLLQKFNDIGGKALKYSIVKDSNADLTVGNWESKIDP